MKMPVYEVEVIASTNDGITYHPIKVLTLDDCYSENNYEELNVVGYIEVGGEQQ